MIFEIIFGIFCIFSVMMLLNLLNPIKINFKNNIPKEKEFDFPELENEIEELKEEIRRHDRMKQLEAERDKLEVELNGFKQDGEIDYEKAYNFAKHTIKYHSQRSGDDGYWDTFDMGVASRMCEILSKLENYERNT